MIFTILILLGSCNQTRKGENENTSQTKTQTDFVSISVLLDSIHVEDQKYRQKIETIADKFGWESKEMSKNWKLISETDSSNLIVVNQILNEYGWLSADQIGEKANSTLFLVIQHSDQETQEKYLPMMRNAVKEGNASASSLALLEDRIALGNGELQIYGSQVGKDPRIEEVYVLPLMEPEKVNERRASVGLGTIEDNLSRWDLEWDVEEYKRKLPKYIEIQKSRKQ